MGQQRKPSKLRRKRQRKKRLRKQLPRKRQQKLKQQLKLKQLERLQKQRKQQQHSKVTGSLTCRTKSMTGRKNGLAERLLISACLAMAMARSSCSLMDVEIFIKKRFINKKKKKKKKKKIFPRFSPLF